MSRRLAGPMALAAFAVAFAAAGGGRAAPAGKARGKGAAKPDPLTFPEEDAPVPAKPVPAPPKLKPPAPAAARTTRCAVCHTTVGWGGADFNHAATGFPLRGGHTRVTCRACHTVDLQRAVPDTCAACHRDVHAREFGMRCEGCHDENSWRTNFTADAHRRTNFPLNGRHALIPCEECHREKRDRGFTRVALDCNACHQADYQATALGAIDHAAAGFSTDCRQCHDTWRFRPARFAAHDRCFQISQGPHAGISCTGCHTGPPGTQVTGMCVTNNAACTRCHTCGSVDGRHGKVAGYQCKDRKCFECHRFSTGG